MPTGSKALTVRLTVDLDPDLHLKLRHLSIDRKESLQVMTTRLLREYVRREARNPSRRKGVKKRR